MKRIFNLLLAMLAILGVACTPNNGGGNENNNGGGEAPTMTFAIDIADITLSGATINVTPSSDATYFFDVVDKAKIDSYATPLEYATESIKNLKLLIGLFGIPLSDYLSTGHGSATLDSLTPDTEYYAYAFGLTADGEITSEVCLEYFKTLPDTSGPSDNTFVLEVSEITVSGAVVSITPSKKDHYYFDVIEKSVYDQIEGDVTAKLAENLKNFCEEEGYTFGDIITYGENTYSFEGVLNPGTEYCAFAFGLSKGGIVTTDITTVFFKTLTIEEASAGIDSGDMNLDDIVGAMYVNYKDYYEVGATNWLISLYNESRMGVLTIDLLSDLSATEIPLGEYPINLSLTPGTVIAGTLDESYANMGTFWRLYNDEWDTVEMAYLKSGTVTIGKSDDIYTINVNAIDGYGNTITASYTGAMENYDYSSSVCNFRNSVNKNIELAPRVKLQKSTSPSLVVKGKRITK